jgi:hypothetical protein
LVTPPFSAATPLVAPPIVAASFWPLIVTVSFAVATAPSALTIA